MKACKECSKPFESTIRSKLYCSLACQKAHGKRIYREKARNRKYAERGLVPGQTLCKECGCIFEFKHNGTKYCSIRCREIGHTKIVQANAIKQAQLSKEKRRNRVRECCQCGKVFSPSYSEKYCSDECRKNGVKKSIKRKWLKDSYGITVDQFDELKRKQNNQCLICGQSKKLVVDHCHSNGHVRGLLCSNCNSGIGLLGEDVSNLKNAIKYLKERHCTGPLDQ